MAAAMQQVLQDESLSCPVCLDTLTAPIIQCVRGHSFCRACITNVVTVCPTCRDKINGNTRNYQLEHLIERFSKIASTKVFCVYKSAGCRYDLLEKDKQSHEKQCRFRPMVCEGDKFGALKCNWSGAYVDLHHHFLEKHKNNCVMQFKTEAKYTINYSNNFKDIQLINWMNDTQFFYYKFKLDAPAQKAFWAIQFIGFEKIAKNFLYEFEIFNQTDRKIKFTEICASDSEDINKIFSDEKCAHISFKTMKLFLNPEKELYFRFRIIKKPPQQNPLPKK